MTEQKIFKSEKWKLANGLNHTDMHTYARTRMHTHTHEKLMSDSILQVLSIFLALWMELKADVCGVLP